MRMALLHDLGESIIGDWDALQTKLDGRQAEKQQTEDEALRKILALLPKDIESKYLGTLKELSARETEESKLFRQLDRLETILQAIEYQKEGHDKKKFEAFWGAKSSVQDEELLKIVELLEKEREEK
jgi:putative hydrolase of HD superfamily